ncbi:class I SAM-dependent methyltransferase [Brachybacterium paraconglomeratum]|uniref:class I SAM-dependent methyltransferase n=1 Tax=Brachybacterium paraconglomeratum TaxID=173362 RepID=UPI0035196C16
MRCADLPDGELLDVGCGTGRLAERAERAGRTVTALDADESMVEAARRRLRGQVLRTTCSEAL